MLFITRDVNNFLHLQEENTHGEIHILMALAPTLFPELPTNHYGIIQDDLTIDPQSIQPGQLPLDTTWDDVTQHLRWCQCELCEVSDEDDEDRWVGVS